MFYFYLIFIIIFQSVLYQGSTSPSETKVLSDTSISPNSQKNRSITSPRQENLRKLSLFDVDQKPVYELVETVRRNTQLSHELSRVAVVTVIEGKEKYLNFFCKAKRQTKIDILQSNT